MGACQVVITMHDVARTVGSESSRKIFGEPHETADGTTIIPVSRPSRWRGTTMRPVGVFVIHDGKVAWQPAVDSTRIALMGETIGLAAAVIATLAVLRRPPWPDLGPRSLVWRQRPR